jgi:hypothetical protein
MVIAPDHRESEVHFAMCMNCGCGQVNERHKPTDIVLDDLKAAAQGHDMEVEEAADNIHNGARELKQSGKIS